MTRRFGACGDARRHGVGHRGAHLGDIGITPGGGEGQDGERFDRSAPAPREPATAAATPRSAARIARAASAECAGAASRVAGSRPGGRGAARERALDAARPASRCRRVLFETALDDGPASKERRRAAGLRQSGGLVSIAANVSVALRPPNVRRPARHLVEDAAERPDVGRRPRRARRAACSGDM